MVAIKLPSVGTGRQQNEGGKQLCTCGIPKAPVPVAVEAQTLTSLKHFFPVWKVLHFSFLLSNQSRRTRRLKKTVSHITHCGPALATVIKTGPGPRHAAGAVKVT